MPRKSISLFDSLFVSVPAGVPFREMGAVSRGKDEEQRNAVCKHVVSTCTHKIVLENHQMSTFQYSLNAHKRSLKRLKAKEVKRKVQWKTFEEERDERKRDDLQLNSCAFQGERMSLPRGERK